MKKTHWTMAVFLTGMAVAAFASAADVTLTNVTARQRYPWNGLVDIDFELICSDPGEALLFSVSARDMATGTDLPVRTVKVEGGEFGDALVAKAEDLPEGKGRFTWNALADAAGTVSDAVTVTVQADIVKYIALDLSAGSGSGAKYPILYLGDEPEGGWSDEYKTTKLVLRRIPAGTFTMGSPNGEVGHNSYGQEDLHEVTLTQPFYISVFEVTQKQWELVMGTKPSYFSNVLYYATRPVEYVSYDMIRGTSAGTNWPASHDVDATSFLGKLRAKTTGANGMLWELPTEAQWEYACRAGTTTALNTGKNLSGTGIDANMDEAGRYFFNTTTHWHDYGWTSDGGNSPTSEGTATVGSYLPNAWGLYDMHGNDSEWCLDWYTHRLGTNAATNPKGPLTADMYTGRMVRGGSWSWTGAQDCRSAARAYAEPSYAAWAGCRLVLIPEE